MTRAAAVEAVRATIQAVRNASPADDEERIAQSLAESIAADQTPDAGEQQAVDLKTLVQRTRATMQRNLDVCTQAKSGIERRMADADRDRANAMQTAENIYREIIADATAELEQVTAVREAVDLAVSRLNKASS